MFKLLAPLVARLGISSLIPAGGILTVAGSALSAALSFFSTPVGKWVGIALIGGGLYVAGDLHRAAIDKAAYDQKWKAAVAESEAKAAERDADIHRQVSADADRRIAEIQRESEQLQSKVAEYEQAFSASNAAACIVSADDARRLRDLGYAAHDPGRGAGRVRAAPAGGRPAAGAGR